MRRLPDTQPAGAGGTDNDRAVAVQRVQEGWAVIIRGEPRLLLPADAAASPPEG
jgi:hypothetical protein